MNESLEAKSFALFMSIILAGISSWLISLFIVSKMRGKPFHEVLNDATLADTTLRYISILAYILALLVVVIFITKS